MHYNVLFLFLISINCIAQPYAPLYTPIFPPFGYDFSYTQVEPEEDYEKDRGRYHSRYSNEYTALPESDEPEIYTIDCPPINPYENTEIIIMDYSD